MKTTVGEINVLPHNSHYADPKHEGKFINNPKATYKTYTEIKAWLDTYKNTHKFVEHKYVCGDFAADVHNAAERAGIKCREVHIKYIGSWTGHIMVNFHTKEGGDIFYDGSAHGAIYTVPTLLGKRSATRKVTKIPSSIYPHYKGTKGIDFIIVAE